MVREVARDAGIGKRIHPHLLRHTVATRLLALGMHFTDIQKFLGHEDIAATPMTAKAGSAGGGPGIIHNGGKENETPNRNPNPANPRSHRSDGRGSLRAAHGSRS